MNSNYKQKTRIFLSFIIIFSLLCINLNFTLISNAATPVTYYVSSINGNNNYNGLSSSTPWASFYKIPTTLNPGDTVLFERGSTWSTPLVLSGVGTSTSFITLSAYGSGALPKISLSNGANDTCITINEGSYWRINNLDLRNSRMGIYLRYISTINNNNMSVQNCYFYNINCSSVISTLIDNNAVTAELHRNNDEYVWPAAIFVGGRIAVDSKSTKVQNIIITDNTFDQCYTGIGSDWYIADSGTGDQVSRITTNLWWIDKCTITGTTNGIFALSKASNSTIQNCRTLSGSTLTSPMGTTGAFLQNCYNFTIQYCEFSNIKNNGSVDGCGIDFEGNNKSVTFKNNVLANNEGSAILLCATFGVNTGIYISNSTLYNNCTRPYGTDWSYEILSWNSGNTGTITNVGTYKGPAVGYSNSLALAGFGYTNCRSLNYYSVNTLPSFWLWNTPNNFEGWTNLNNWGSGNVNGGYLNGISTGTDMFNVGPATFINGYLQSHLNIKFHSTLGGTAQLFFTTDTEPSFSGDKSITFNYTPGSNDVNLIIDLATNQKWKGVITGLRIDPTSVSGSSVSIDHLSIQQ